MSLIEDQLLVALKIIRVPDMKQSLGYLRK